jgi:hypothetical protein
VGTDKDEGMVAFMEFLSNSGQGSEEDLRRERSEFKRKNMDISIE